MGKTVAEIFGEMSQYYKNEEIEQKGPLVLTIKGLDTQEFKDMKTEELRKKPVISFEESSKKLILNKTNAKQFREVVGEGDPVGKKIRVSFEMTTYLNGKRGPLVCVSEAE